MDNRIMTEVCKRVYRDYPEFHGVNPKVSSQAEDRYLLLFNTSSKTANGKSIARSLRVVVNAKGKILKATTSR